MSISPVQLAANGTFHVQFNVRIPPNMRRYACPSSSNSKFVGCCQTDADPCATGCAAGALQSANYNGSYYGKFPDATCGSTSQFFTCGLDPNGKDTFWGCCKSNPCANNAVCPAGSLTNAYIELPEQFAFYASSTLPSSVSSTSTATASATGSSGGGSGSNSAVIGGAVGGVIGALLIIGLVVFFLWRRRRNAKTVRGDNVEVASPMMSDPKAFGPHSPTFAAQSRKCPNKFNSHSLTHKKRHQHTLPPTEITTRVWHHKAKSTPIPRAHIRKGSGLTLPMVLRRWKQTLARQTGTLSFLLRLSDPPRTTGTPSCQQGRAVESRPITRRRPRRARMNRYRRCRKGWA
jgi:hypothetical protein